MKIWAKLLTDHKIQKDILYYSEYPMKFASYEIWVREICDKLDIPSPVILPYHYKNFVHFHNSKFKPDDFIEALDYDQFIIEDCKEY